MIYRLVIHWPGDPEDIVELEKPYKGNPHSIPSTIELFEEHSLIRITFKNLKVVDLLNVPCEIYRKNG